MVAVLAKRHNIPFYVARPLQTIDLCAQSGEDIPIEERSADEINAGKGYNWSTEKVNVFNPAFDITPADLVTALVAEKVIVKQPNLKCITNLFSR